MPNSDLRGQQQYTGAGSAQVNIGADVNKNLLTSLGTPFYTETSRLGQGYTVQLSSGVAPLAALPTTTAALEVYNNHPTKVMVVRDLFIWRLLGTAAAQSHSIWAMVTTQKAAPSLSALTVYSLSGRASVTPTATSEIVTGAGTTVVANGWRPYGNPWPLATEAATPEGAMSVDINGRLIIPKGCSLCLHAVAATAVGTVILGLSFDWLPITVEA